MASVPTGLEAELGIPYTFQDLSLLQRALKAGDSNSDDREGHRGMAQVGDNLMSFVITSEGFDRGISRKELQDTISLFGSKAMCSTLARAHRLDQMVVISERQKPIGPQPTTLKNVLAAIVAAVWFDSRDYGSIVPVMASLGLINHVESPSSPQNRNVTPPSSEGSEDPDHCQREMDTMMSGIDFDAFLDTGPLDPEWLSTMCNTDIPSDGLDVDLIQSLNMVPELAPFSSGSQTQAAISEQQLVLDEMTTTVDLSTIYDRNGIEQPAVDFYDSIYNPDQAAVISIAGTNEDGANDNVAQWSPNASQTSKKRKPGAGTSRRRDSSTTARSSRVGTPIRLAFKVYQTREMQKFEQQPEVFNQHYGHMFEYQEELSSIKTGHHKVLATMALAIGDYSAISILKQAIQSVRSPTAGSAFHVGQVMSPEQRLKAINDLDLCMAHLRLARWLHIHKLYEAILIEVGGVDADGFMVMTNADLDQSSNGTRNRAQRGNPRNQERASVTRRMMDHTGASNARESDQKNTTSMKRLRRVGQRLHLLVNRWGIGVLSLLGPTWTEDEIMKAPDNVFAQFLDVVDRFEGHNIRAVSQSAARGVELFIYDSPAAPVLSIEVVDQDVLKRLPRLSQDMVALFSMASWD